MGLLLLATVAGGAASCAYVYGINDDNQIVDYNPKIPIAPRIVLDMGLAGFQASNSFAFDRDR